MQRPFATLLLSVTLAALLASSASASGVNLSWGDCGAAGTLNKSFACNSNTLDAVIVASFQPTYGTFAMTSVSTRMDIAFASAGVPDWWMFKNAGSCRQTALSVSSMFTTGTWSCPDPWQGLASGGITLYMPNYRSRGANTAHFEVVFAVPTTSAITLESPNEYLAFQIKLSGIKTVGTGSCSGCTTPACIVWNHLLIQGPNFTHIATSFPLDHNYVTWQGGVVSGGCPAATPVRNRTWGQLKSLYE